MADLTLIPEDGTGLSTANSYNSLAELDDYLEARPESADWQELEEHKKQRAAISAFHVRRGIAPLQIRLARGRVLASPTDTATPRWPQTSSRRS
jgi:hypothetical protein